FQGEGTEDWVKCYADFNIGFTVPIRVVKCSKYYSKADARKPSLHDMMEQAYILTEDGPMKHVGFVKPTEWRKHNKGEDVVPGGIPDFD
ncbi:hypothetical protein LCGC14_3069540, partial [marine sediment metagenome]